MRSAALPANPTLEPSPPPRGGKPLDMSEPHRTLLKQLDSALLGKQPGGRATPRPTRRRSRRRPRRLRRRRPGDALERSRQPSTHRPLERQPGRRRRPRRPRRIDDDAPSRDGGARRLEAGATAAVDAATHADGGGEPRTPAPADSDARGGDAAPQRDDAPRRRRGGARCDDRDRADAARPRRRRASAAPAPSSTASSSGETISSMAQLNSDERQRHPGRGHPRPDLARGREGSDAR